MGPVQWPLVEGAGRRESRNLVGAWGDVGQDRITYRRRRIRIVEAPLCAMLLQRLRKFARGTGFKSKKASKLDLHLGVAQSKEEPIG